MLCQEGAVSLKCYCGTAGGILLITIPQIYYEIVPAGISGAMLWGPLLYFAVLNMALPLIWKFNNPSYKVSHLSIKKFQIFYLFPFLDRCEVMQFGILFRSLCTYRSFCPCKFQTIWVLWQFLVFLPLFRVSQHSLGKSNIFVLGFFHVESFSSLSFGSSSKLDRVFLGDNLFPYDQVLQIYVDYWNFNVRFGRSLKEISNDYSQI